jgi:hypothetical protein
MNKTIIVIASVLLIVASLIFGVFWGEKTANKAISAEAKQLDSLINSALLHSLTFAINGEITAINGRTLTLSAEGKSCSVNVEEDAEIRLARVMDENGEYISRTEYMEFNSIKMGDEVTVVLQGMAIEGFALSGKSVIVIAQK